MTSTVRINMSPKPRSARSHIISGLAFSLAALAAPVAYAQPSDPAPVPVPPSSTQSGTSKIEGQLVPVGEHNRYEYEYKRVNLTTNPLGYIFGSYGASVGYAVHSNLALRVDANYFDPVDGNVQGYEFGVGAPIYFRKVYSGLFLEPGFSTRFFESETSSESARIYGPQVLIGWHWYWDSGLNAALAAGFGRNWTENGSDEFEDYNDIFPAGYLRFGYAF
jgi:hypothetical protein